MNRLDELIRELCPDGVEYKQLKNVSEMRRGTSVTKKEMIEGKIPVVSGGRTPAYYCDTYNRDGETITVAGSGAGAGYVQFWDSPIFVCDAFSIKGNEHTLTKYLYYVLTNNQEYIYSTQKGSGVPHVHISSIENMKLPVPPMEIQREIVHILEQFNLLIITLTEKLVEELTVRKQQYQFYLDSFYEPKEHNLITIRELGTLVRGKRFVHADATDKGVPCIHYGELYTHYGVHAKKVKSHIQEELRNKMRYACNGDVIIVGAGENNIDIGIGVAWEGTEKVAVHDACYILSHNQNAKYISYYLRSNMYHRQIKKYVSRGKICSISANDIGKALIPIPTIEEQQRIVSILERLDARCREISDDLSTEIAMRQKQYEYYRDKLLNFKERDA